MTSNAAEQRVQTYLAEVSDGLSDIPEQDRDEILGDLEAHIEDAVQGDIRMASESDILNVLDRLGHPQDVAREARELRGHPAVSTPDPVASSRNPYADEQRKTPGALEIAAIVLTALLWPIGIVLAWVSHRWKTRDKLIATAFPLASALVLLAILVGGTVVWSTSGTTVTMVSDQAEPAPAMPQDPAQTEPRSPAEISESSNGSGMTSRFLAVLGFLLGVVAGPFIGAVYLAIRLQPDHRPAAPPQQWSDGVAVRS